jgi:hypothetical protein
MDCTPKLRHAGRQLIRGGKGDSLNCVNFSNELAKSFSICGKYDATIPRRSRRVVSGVPYHTTQRGVNKSVTFSTEDDHQTYLRLLRDNSANTGVRLLGWCLMTDHAHLIATPDREDSLAVLFRRVQGKGEGKGGQPELR